MIKILAGELREHAPFTAFGAIIGVIILVLVLLLDVSHDISERLFETFHPLHVLFSAFATTAMYRLHTRSRWWMAVLIGYTGSIGIATLSDSLIPYVGENMLDLPEAHVHAGFIEDWWLVNPMAFLGIVLGFLRPVTKFPHGAHVFLSTAASLFHIIMAVDDTMEWILILPIFVFLILAVLLPCCMSDIIYPLLFTSGNGHAHESGHGHHDH